MLRGLRLLRRNRARPLSAAAPGAQPDRDNRDRSAAAAVLCHVAISLQAVECNALTVRTRAFVGLVDGFTGPEFGAVGQQLHADAARLLLDSIHDTLGARHPVVATALREFLEGEPQSCALLAAHAARPALGTMATARAGELELDAAALEPSVRADDLPQGLPRHLIMWRRYLANTGFARGLLLPPAEVAAAEAVAETLEALLDRSALKRFRNASKGWASSGQKPSRAAALWGRLMNVMNVIPQQQRVVAPMLRKFLHAPVADLHPDSLRPVLALHAPLPTWSNMFDHLVRARAAFARLPPAEQQPQLSGADDDDVQLQALAHRLAHNMGRAKYRAFRRLLQTHRERTASDPSAALMSRLTFFENATRNLKSPRLRALLPSLMQHVDSLSVEMLEDARRAAKAAENDDAPITESLMETLAWDPAVRLDEAASSDDEAKAPAAEEDKRECRRLTAYAAEGAASGRLLTPFPVVVENLPASVTEEVLFVTLARVAPVEAVTVYPGTPPLPDAFELSARPLYSRDGGNAPAPPPGAGRHASNFAVAFCRDADGQQQLLSLALRVFGVLLDGRNVRTQDAELRRSLLVRDVPLGITPEYFCDALNACVGDYAETDISWSDRALADPRALMADRCTIDAPDFATALALMQDLQGRTVLDQPIGVSLIARRNNRPMENPMVWFSGRG